MATLILVGDFSDADKAQYCSELTLVHDVHLIPDNKTLMAKLHSFNSNATTDTSHAMVIVHEYLASHKDSRLSRPKLNQLTYEEMEEVLRQHFIQLNIMVFTKKSLTDLGALNKELHVIHQDFLKNRILRMKTWMGLGSTHHTHSLPGRPSCSSNVYTMCKRLLKVLDATVEHDEVGFTDLLQELDFMSLMEIPHDQQHYLNKIGSWAFPAHEFSTDELIYCSLLMFKHAMESLEHKEMVISDNRLLGFLFAIKNSYHSGNSLHNFRHAVDVLQASFHMIVSLGFYPVFEGFQLGDNTSYPDYDFLNSLETFILLISAIGHDVGHPGTSNVLMSKFDSPVSQLYNGKSILENFHATAFIHKLRHHWPELFLVKQSQTILVDSILSTDMGKHGEYIDDKLIEPLVKYVQDPATIDTAKNQLALSLIIKAADISNVSRPLDISTKWAILISYEFSECSVLDKHLTSGENVSGYVDPQVVVPDTVEESLKMYPSIPNGQIFFINTFAARLFEQLGHVFPQLKFLEENVTSNKRFWTSKV